MSKNKGAQQPPKHLVVGRIVRPHGIQGAVIVEALSPMIRTLEADTHILLGDPPQQETVVSFRKHRDRYLIHLANCSSRDEAEQIRGMEIRLPFDSVEPLPEGEYYYWQVLGISVITVDGQNLGKVDQIIETGANDVYVVRDERGKERLIPAIQQVIKQVDLDQRILEVELLPGLLED